MGDGEETLADRWMRGLRNNPIVATMIVIGALIAIAGPVLNTVRGVILKDEPAATSVNVEAFKSDRDNILVPVRNALRENKVLFERLSSPLFNEPGWGVQESYYERVRRDGAEKHQLMGGMIDSLVQNNRKILDKLDPYVGRARTQGFKRQEELFREHAQLYEARWKGMKAAALSGEAQPIAEPAFPAQFPVSLDAEINAVEKMTVGRPET